jgi:hypothetical protein
VEDAVGVHVVEASGQLLHDLGGLRGRELTPRPQALLEVAAGHQLQGQVGAALGLAGFVDPQHVGMPVHRRLGGGLPREALAQGRVVVEQELEAHGSPGGQLSGAEHDAHGAASQLLHQLVAGHPCTRDQADAEGNMARLATHTATIGGPWSRCTRWTSRRFPLAFVGYLR